MLSRFGRVVDNASLSDYTTYKLVGKIDKVVYPSSVSDLRELILYLNENNIKYMVLGNGSNVIIGDYHGVVIKLDDFDFLDINGDVLKVGAGYSLIKLAIEVANMGLKGLEFAAGIPAQVGGAVYMNAGAYNASLSDVILNVTVLTDDGRVLVLNNDDLNFGYRYSLLMEKRYVCLDATLKLEYADKDEIMEIIKRRRQRRIETQPLSFPSAGSVFRNPFGDYAGRLIESAGLKGMSVGGASVSLKHANFIVTDGKASFNDVVLLIDMVKKRVKEDYDIDLKVEQIIVE